MTRALAIIFLVACGDSAHRELAIASVSGTQLVVQRYRYDDGTEQVDPTTLYDRVLHAQCRPQVWIDGTVRCVPLADPAVYLDAECTMPVGRAVTLSHPTHFLGFDRATGLPSQVFEVTRTTVEVPQYYVSTAGGCGGPTTSEMGVTYYTLGDEVDSGVLASVRDGELGGGRIALRTLESDDGLRLIVGALDRELGVACRPALRRDGSVWCAPVAAAPAQHFLDPACSEPAVAVGAGETPPALAAVADPTGCASYRAIAGEHTGQTYRRAGDSCIAEPVSQQRTFGLGAPIEPVALARTVEGVAGRRIQRIILDSGDLQFFDDRVFDTTTGSDCRPRQVQDRARCLPTPLASPLRLQAAGCTRDQIVAELPRRACFPVAYAASRNSVREIGAPVVEPLFTPDGSMCRPYTPAPDAELRALGPPLDPTMFAGAILFGER